MSYTEEQLRQYFAHLGYDPRADPSRPANWHETDPLGFLTELQARQLARVPFESLSMHYSSRSPPLSLDLQDLFDKVVVQRRGGYCMELNTFFGAVLRGLGFTLINVAGRVMGHDGTCYLGSGHMLNLVSINGKRYMVDVGFGKDCSFSPVPLDRENGAEFTPLPATRGRLEYCRVPQHSDPSQRVWVYSTREEAEDGGPVPAWQPRYCFVENEYFPADYEVMNYYTMTHPNSYFVQAVLAMRTILEEEEEEGAADARDHAGHVVGGGGDDGGERPRAKGVLVLHKDEVKRTIWGKTELLERLTSEEQRIEALRRYFDLVVTPEQAACIRGRHTEIRGGE